VKKYYLFILILFIPGFYSCNNDKKSEDKGVSVMAYYYTRWENFKPDSLPYDKLTHIIFSFTEVIDNEMKFPEDTLDLMLKALVKQKKKHPHLKVMVACGGWAGSGGFSEMARTPETRKKFVDSVVKFIKKYKLDGLDIDWEYPGLPGMGNPFIPEDKENFTALMCELREGLNSICEHQVLTFAGAGWEEAFNHIELEKVMQCLTYVNVMSYDLAGGEDPYTSHHTNLGLITMQDLQGTPAALKMVEEGDSTKPFSTEKIVAYLIGRGVKPSQIVIGSNFSGRAWQGVPPENNGLYQLNRGRWRGRGNYGRIREEMEDKNGFVRYWDPIAKAPWLYCAKDSVFITYDDTMSVRLKTKYAAELGLGGIMFWQLGADAKENGLVDAIYAEKMRHWTVK
jgi:chitinase